MGVLNYNFPQFYSQVAHAKSFIINIFIADTHWLAARVLDVSNVFQN